MAFLFQVGSKTMMNLWFALDNASFTEQFCVNKEDPKKGCHGSCMMKKINEAPREKDDLTPFRINIQLRLSDYLPSQGLSDVCFSAVHPIEKSFCYFFKYCFLYSSTLFHPPQTASLCN
jgi:hypothetical protein